MGKSWNKTLKKEGSRMREASPLFECRHTACHWADSGRAAALAKRLGILPCRGIKFNLKINSKFDTPKKN